MMDKRMIKRIHFVGLAGVAMTALAVYVKERGIRVTGSDIPGLFPTHSTLKKAGLVVQEGFLPEHVNHTLRPDIVIFTGAHGGKENIEVKTALELHIPVMSHGEALGFFMDGCEQISVAGSHGKTTTSAMIATIFCESGKDPSYAIGCGDIIGVGFPGHFGNGSLFIAEADEYVTDPQHDTTPRFLWQHPDILVVTNIDFDHPDAYTSLSAVKDAFKLLQKQQQGKQLTIVNVDDRESRDLLTGTNVLRYGCSPQADIRITHVTMEQERTFFTLSMRGIDVGEFALKVPGKHNVLNATAAAACAVSYGISWDDIRNGILAFGGTKRRFQKLGEIQGISIFDDYAHHPKEIQATLEAARAWFPHRRIISIFQPHTYSRTKALLADFATSFTRSDMVLLTDIFASARESDTLGISTATLVEEIAKHHGCVRYTKNKEETLEFLSHTVLPGDIIILMGAGDIFEWGPDIVRHAKDWKTI